MSSFNVEEILNKADLRFFYLFTCQEVVNVLCHASILQHIGEFLHYRIIAK